MKTLTEAVKACGGVWPSTVVPDGYMVDFISPTVYTITTSRLPEYICSRAEFDAEAARLSGKPGWGEAPEGSNARVQDSMGYWHFGEFPAGSKYPVPKDNGNWESGDGKWLNGVSRLKGTVLGDWRDTLERRPEGVVESESPAAMWMPPAGAECELLWTSPDEYYRVRVIGHDQDNEEVVGRWLEGPKKGVIFSEKQESWPGHDNFRPLKSDRERWCERVETLTNHLDECSMNQVYACIYDALKDGVLSVPE